MRNQNEQHHRRRQVSELAGAMATSAALASARRLWQANELDRNLPLTGPQKAQVGAYLLLRDFAAGKFPPRHEHQAEVFAAEVGYRQSTPGLAPEHVAAIEMRKPFWSSKEVAQYLDSFVHMVEALDSAGIGPEAYLLEMGGGSGWTAEFLSLMGYRVVSTTIAPDDVDSGHRRVASIAAKGLSPSLEFIVSPMEHVDLISEGQELFDAVFVFEALHHAYDWRAAIGAAFRSLRPGGSLLICNEPNLSHTYVSYRVAQLTGVIERGFSGAELRRACFDSGFTKVTSLRWGPGFGIRPHWVVATKPKQ